MKRSLSTTRPGPFLVACELVLIHEYILEIYTIINDKDLIEQETTNLPDIVNYYSSIRSDGTCGR